jgi:deazaflavin-dependent oxidoreductase (nitroreductase family)
MVRLLLRLGLAGKHTWLLTVAGRKSGKPYSTPVTLIAEDGHEWIVAPYGERQWVKNLRVAGEARLSSGRRQRAVRAGEVSAAEAAPVIRLYVQRVPITRKFWDVTPTSTDAELVTEAARHPVFLVSPAKA